MESKIRVCFQALLALYMIVKSKHVKEICMALVLLEIAGNIRSWKPIQEKPLIASAPQEKEKPDVFQRLRHMAEMYVGGQQVSFLNMGVIVGDELVFKHSHGVRDIHTKEPVSSDSAMRFFSLTKSVTATAVMILVDEGVLTIDDPVANYLPEFDKTEVYLSGNEDDIITQPIDQPITIKHLLTHTAGFSYGIFGAHIVDILYQQKLGSTLGAFEDPSFIETLASIPLLYQPGTRFTYSLSIDVLAILIHRVVLKHKNVTFHEFVQAEIFGPLKMKDTDFVIKNGCVSRFCTLYSTSEEQGFGLNVLGSQMLEALGASSLTEENVYRGIKRSKMIPSGGGGMVSTQDDYLKFLSFLARKGVSDDGKIIVKRETIALFTEVNHIEHMKPVDPEYQGKVDVPSIHFDQSGFKDYAFYQGMGWSLIGWLMVDKSKAFGAEHAVEGEYGWSGLGGLWYGISHLQVRKNGVTGNKPVVLFYQSHTMPDKGLPTQPQFRYAGMKSVREYLEDQDFELIN